MALCLPMTPNVAFNGAPLAARPLQGLVRRHTRQPRSQSAFMPASRMTLAQRSTSALTKFSVSVTLMATGWKPCSMIRALISGVPAILLTSALIFKTMSRGVA